jgi:hypothetical protein
MAGRSDLLPRDPSGLAQAAEVERLCEPDLHEMLEDPVLQTVMARDGVSREEILGLARWVRKRRVLLSRSRAPAMPMPPAFRPAADSARAGD